MQVPPAPVACSFMAAWTLNRSACLAIHRRTACLVAALEQTSSIARNPRTSRTRFALEMEHISKVHGELHEPFQ